MIPPRSQDKDADRLPSPAAVLLLYTGCVLTVFGFVNLFPLYQRVNEMLGTTFVSAAPFLLPLAMLALLLRGISSQMPMTAAFNWRLIAPGLGLCMVALLLPDPDFSVKRIHLFQYLLLSLLVRYTMSRRLEDHALLIFSILFGSLLGVHDEFLQGLHPQRTYGLRDMLVNAVSVTGGSLIWHGLGLFSQCRSPRTPVSVTGTAVLFLILHVAAVLALIVPLVAYRNETMPLWPFVPTAAIIVFSCCHLLTDSSSWRHGLLVQNLLLAAVFAYPLVTNAFEIPFH